MNKLVTVVMLVGLVMSSGCASMMNYSGSKKDYSTRVATQRAVASNDQAIIKAVAMGNTVAAGVDLLDPAFWDVMAEHPVRATVAAVADLATAAAATWAITSTIDNSHHDTVSISGNNNAMNYNQGNGNSNSGTTTPGNNNQTPGGQLNEGNMNEAPAHDVNMN
jgi:uncharacterized protein YceK